MDENRIVPFPDEGVEFIFPANLSDVGVIKRKLVKHKGVGSFKPKRHIVRVLLYSIENQEELTMFGAGFEIKVKFTTADLRAQDPDDDVALRMIDLGYYEEKKGDYIWVSCRDHHEYTQEPIKDPRLQGQWVGYAIVKIKEWPDPEMGWGP